MTWWKTLISENSANLIYLFKSPNLPLKVTILLQKLKKSYKLKKNMHALEVFPVPYWRTDKHEQEIDSMFEVSEKSEAIGDKW